MLPEALTLGEEWQLELPDGLMHTVTTAKGWEEQGLAAYSRAAAYWQSLPFVRRACRRSAAA